ncbi:phage coat protein, partial [Candidatus Pacearchaeota archaeon]|nr:phage coat protein [Candidatus Pacearchaeota archaeon]
LTYVTRRASDAGQVQTSMSGQVGIKMDQVEYNHDGTIVPIHDTGFFRNWREWNAQKAENFDGLIDDSRESTAAVRVRLADSFMDGHNDKDGNKIIVDTRSWGGIRNDARVQSVDLGAGGVNFDFTDNTKTGDEIKTALITVLDFLWITNDCAKDVTLYISREIGRNWERNFSANYDGALIIDQLAKIQGVAAIKTTNKVSDNELMAFPLDRSAVVPVVGMGISTMALPRPMYNSNYEFAVATATGWIVKTDYFDKTCALYAVD